jgi:hypothetical protein
VLNLETPMSGDRDPPDRARLEADWLTLTRQTLPTLAKARRWPVSADHCFMRILLDAVHKGRWDTVVQRRPAYKYMDLDRLLAAVALAKAVAEGREDLPALNAQSLAWRRKSAVV